MSTQCRCDQRSSGPNHVYVRSDQDIQAEWVESYVRRGWITYLLTFTFEPIGGSTTRVAAIMQAEVERAHKIFVTRANRKPRSKYQQGNLPIWIVCYDYPVVKHARQTKQMILPNDGRHAHATLVMPPFSRMPDVEAHFLKCERIYLRPDCPLDSIDCHPVISRPGYAHEYVIKAMLNGRVSGDEWFVLPKSLSEL